MILGVNQLNRKRSLLLLAFVIGLLGACGNAQNEGSGTNDETPEILEVKLEGPDAADVNEKVVFTALVTQGDEKVKDADEVEFEIWEEGKKDEGEMIEAKNNEDGTYEMERAFDRNGQFTVQVHVTARGMHNMPKKSIAVGEGAADEHEHEHEHGEHAHSDEFNMHFMKPGDLQADKESELTVHLENEGKPLEKARVRFEIWHEKTSDQHDWVDVEEGKSGEYSGIYTFKEAGKYTVKIHVEGEDGLHEHEEHELEVK